MRWKWTKMEAILRAYIANPSYYQIKKWIIKILYQARMPTTQRFRQFLGDAPYAPCSTTKTHIHTRSYIKHMPKELYQIPTRNCSARVYVRLQWLELWRLKVQQNALIIFFWCMYKYKWLFSLSKTYINEECAVLTTRVFLEHDVNFWLWPAHVDNIATCWNHLFGYDYQGYSKR